MNVGSKNRLQQNRMCTCEEQFSLEQIAPDSVGDMILKIVAMFVSRVLVYIFLDLHAVIPQFIVPFHYMLID